MYQTKIRKELEGFNVAVVSHTRGTGLSQFLKEWLLLKAKKTIFIGHPLYPTKNLNSSMEVYEKGELKKTYNSSFLFSSGILLYIKDAFFTLFYFLKAGCVVDIAIGVDNLNTLVLLFFKKIGRVKKIIYHTVDYTPNRFSNIVLNKIYHIFDRWCCYNADIIWNSSGRMNDGRIINGADKQKIVKTIITPDGSNFDYKKRLPISKINRKLIVFLGHLRERLGLELLIKSFANVVYSIKDAKLLIIGDGPLLNNLKKLTFELKISKSVEFTGFIKKHSDVDNKLKKGAVGIAMFEPVKDSFEYYSDAGKPKVYLSGGLPVIITRVPEIADEIGKKNAGFVITYDENELSKTIISFLKDDKLYAKYRENAIELSKKYIWDNIFYKAFDETLKYFKWL